MGRRDVISHTDNLNMSFAAIRSAVPMFPTKKAALAAGAEFGWRDAVRLDARFERAWVVGRMDLHTDEIAGVPREVFRLSTLRWERDENGNQRCPVLKVLRAATA